MSKKEISKRYGFFIIGLFVNALGISLITKAQLGTSPISVIFGYFIDLNMALLSSLDAKLYLLKILFVLMGSTILVLGISIEVIANVVMLSGEAFVKAISSKFNKEFGKTKVFFDITLVTISSIISLFMFHKLVGVREGTIIAALIVGLIAKMVSSKLIFINDKFLLDKKIIKGEEEQEEKLVS